MKKGKMIRKQENSVGGVKIWRAEKRENERKKKKRKSQQRDENKKRTRKGKNEDAV